MNEESDEKERTQGKENIKSDVKEISPQKGFIALSTEFSIPSSPYWIQLGRTNGTWTVRVGRGLNELYIKVFHDFKDNLDDRNPPTRSIIAGCFQKDVPSLEESIDLAWPYNATSFSDSIRAIRREAIDSEDLSKNI